MGRNLGPLNIKDSYEGLVQISGSQLTDGSGSLIPSLEVTASHATTADASISASYAQTSTSSSHALVSDFATTAGSATTAVSSSHAVSSDTAISASYATTASYAENAGSSTLEEVLVAGNTATNNIVLTGEYQRVSGSFSGSAIDNITDTFTTSPEIQHVVSLTQAEYNAIVTKDPNTFYVITDAVPNMITGSVLDATLTFTKEDGTTFPLTVNNVSNAVSSSYALTATSASYALTATSASYAPASPTPTLDQVTTAGNTTSNLISAAGFNGGYLIANAGDLALGTITGDVNIQAAGAVKNVNIEATNKINMTGSVDITGSLTSNGILYPNTDGTTGQVVTTDGLGTLSFSTISATPFPYTGSATISGSLTIDGTLVSGKTTNVLGALAATDGTAVIIGGETNTNNSTRGGIFASKGSTIAVGTAGVVVGGEANQVSGNYYGGVFAGQNNTASGVQAVVLGGQNNSATTQGDAVVGGQSNRAIGNHSAVVGGTGNRADKLRSVVLGGENNYTNTGQGQVIAGGVNNRANGNYSFVGGGINNQALAGDGAIAGGQNNTVNNSDGFIGGGNANTAGSRDAVIGGNTNYAASNNGFHNVVAGGEVNKVGAGTGNFLDSNGIFSGGYNNILGSSGTNRTKYNAILGGFNNAISTPTDATKGSTFSFVIGGQENQVRPDLGIETYISGSGVIGGIANRVVHQQSVVIGGNSQQSQRNDEVTLPNLTISNYAALNYADDTAAAAGGVPLGGVYHNAGILQIRIV